MESNCGLEVYQIDFDEPPAYLKSKLFLILWYINPDVRRIVMDPVWAERITKGKMPHLCLHEGFCRDYESRENLEEHYALNPDHRLTKQDHDNFIADSQLVQYLRQWNFPRIVKHDEDTNQQESEESPEERDEESDEGKIEDDEAEKKQCGFCLEKMSPQVYIRHKNKLWKRCPVFKGVA